MKDKNPKAEAKAAKIQEKLKKREEALEAKRIKKQQKDEEMKALYQAFDADKGLTREERVQKARKVKVKKHKEKVNLKLAFKEAPIKMLKEINKIKWSSRKNLGQKFSWVVVFLLVFALFFYGVDTGLKYLFQVLKII
ncbi:preprotein translocase subunit SecE [Spiroplasma helicoides]|uniref:Preprotein translocase subunit SecE n=1 Tax=Spiroplasma helicoides TaxID=216938 RepID=A0A1B3SJ82_9MOLU|nr:preprotein translocase subunit SecE [Spiroplasma helicoides]AOG59989.1 preprotein translocase subunit SecE [Spiroplasma helicoides]